MTTSEAMMIGRPVDGMAARGNGRKGGGLHVALLSPQWPPESAQNGIVTYTKFMRSALQRLGARVTVLAARVVGDRVEDGVVDLGRFNPSTSAPARALRRLAWSLDGLGAVRSDAARRIACAALAAAESDPFDLIEMEETLGWSDLVSRWTDTPIVVRLHGPWFLNGPMVVAREDRAFRRRVRLEGAAIRAAAAVASPSQDVLDRTREHYGLALAEAETLPLAAPRRPEETRWRMDRCDRDEILFIGRFDAHKGGDVVIRAFDLLAAERPRLRLRFVGPDRGVLDADGRTVGIQEWMRRHVPDERVRERITVTGAMPHDALDDLRRRAFITVIGSRYENFPLAALEASALGCPIVASRAGGLAEIIEDGRTGLLAAPGDASDFAAKIKTLLDDPQRAAALGAAAGQRCATVFDEDTVGRRTLAFFEQTAERLRAGAVAARSGTKST